MSPQPRGCREGDLPAPGWPWFQAGQAVSPWRILSPSRTSTWRETPMLEALGVEAGVELVYRALLARPGAAATALAEEVEVSVADGESALATLVEVGLALRSGEQTYVAAPPAVALGALIADRRDGLRLAEQALAPLAEVHRASVAGQSIDALIE